MYKDVVSLKTFTCVNTKQYDAWFTAIAFNRSQMTSLIDTVTSFIVEHVNTPT